jgi:hypothetical protein
MSDIGKSVGGRRSSAASPFRSLSFVVASILGLCAVMIDVYLICRYWHTAPAQVAPMLALPIGLQLIYQWWRALRCRRKIQELYSKASDDGSPLDVAVRVAAEGMIDVLSFSYGITFFALMLIGLLLSRLEYL